MHERSTLGVGPSTRTRLRWTTLAATMALLFPLPPTWVLRFNAATVSGGGALSLLALASTAFGDSSVTSSLHQLTCVHAAPKPSLLLVGVQPPRPLVNSKSTAAHAEDSLPATEAGRGGGASAAAMTVPSSAASAARIPAGFAPHQRPQRMSRLAYLQSGNQRQ